MKSTPSASSIRRTSASGTWAPPDTVERHEDRSRRPTSGWSIAAISIVGTAAANHGRSSSISSRNSAGSNIGISTSAARRSSAPSTPITHPPVWNSGIGDSHVTPSGISTRSAHSLALSTTLPWRSTAPFGNPVVPLVYWICTGSSAPTAGSSTDEPAVTIISPSRSRRRTWRRSGRSARMASACAASGLPRTSGTRNSPAARDWRST